MFLKSVTWIGESPTGVSSNTRSSGLRSLNKTVHPHHHHHHLIITTITIITIITNIIIITISSSSDNLEATSTLPFPALCSTFHGRQLEPSPLITKIIIITMMIIRMMMVVMKMVLIT